MELAFRPAARGDLDALVRMYGDAIARMRREGIDQWDERYPTREDLEADIGAGEMTLGVIDGGIACAYAVNGACDVEYEDGAWARPDADFCVLHRLCVDPALQGRGIARRAVEHMEAEARRRGVHCVRLDVFSENPRALRLYLGLGYRRAGEVRFRKGAFYLMEKELTEERDSRDD